MIDVFPYCVSLNISPCNQNLKEYSISIEVIHHLNLKKPVSDGLFYIYFISVPRAYNKNRHLGVD